MKPAAGLWGALLASIVASATAQAHSPKMDKNKEKCGGIVKAGRNDCGTAKHDCAGQAQADGVADEWVVLPKGTCDRIVGGKVLK